MWKLMPPFSARIKVEEMVRVLGQNILQTRGYNILAARDAKEALHLAEKHQGPIHLLFTDTIMPGLSGPELAECLAFIHPETKVLHTSGYPDRVKNHPYSKVLSAAFLQKPYTPETLTRKIRDVLASTETHEREAPAC
jgi:DNA-binding NtrC family response regulator